jgi:hypothetical protein
MNVKSAGLISINRSQAEGPDGDWQYQLGVDSGAESGVGDAKAMSESEINKEVEALGIRFENGVQRSVDGYGMTPANLLISNNFAGDPVLPDVAGSMPSPEALGPRLSNLNADIPAGGMAFAAMSEMARTSMVELKTAKEMRNALQKGKFAEKMTSLKAQEKKVEAEKGAAWVNFAWQAVQAGVSIGAGVAGSRGMSAVKAQGFIQASQMLPALGSAIDKQWGFQAEADAQDLYAKSRDIEAERIDMYIDDAQSNYQEAKQAMEKAIKMLEDYEQRRTDIINNIFR